MKRLFTSIALLALLSCYLLSCEKDDICADGTATTPSVVIEFFEAGNTDVPKNVPGLVYQAVGGVWGPIPGDGEPQITGNRIIVPLRTDADTVTWIFRLRTPLTGGEFAYNYDMITFNYERQEAYVSRACGYKTTFQLEPGTDAAPNPALADANAEDGLWIQQVNVLQPNIENEDETHIEIYY